MTLDNTLSKNMSLSQILAVPGIVIRLIPKITKTRYVTVKNGKRFEGKEDRVNSLGGKYLVTGSIGQETLVRFDLKTCGIGETIEVAYADWLSKK